MKHSILRSPKLLVLLPLLVSAAACNPRYSIAAFHLPRDGNPERGKEAFTELGCTACHYVMGASQTDSEARPGLIVLGGTVDRKMTDAYLVTHVLDPSNGHTPSVRARIATTGQPRMPAFADRITVRQLTDIVAFLQSHYQLRPMPPETWYQ